MARLARVIAPGMPHHVTQRGNRRQETFFGEEDYQHYLELMSQFCRAEQVAICSADWWGRLPSPERNKTDNISRGGLAMSRPTLQRARATPPFGLARQRPQEVAGQVRWTLLIVSRRGHGLVLG